MDDMISRSFVVETLIANAKFAAKKARSSLDAGEMTCGFFAAVALGTLALQFALDRLPTKHEAECLTVLTEAYVRGSW